MNLATEFPCRLEPHLRVNSYNISQSCQFSAALKVSKFCDIDLDYTNFFFEYLPYKKS